ncbi:MAG: transcriptional regulator, MerR family [Proteobacteria bacterium]|nr:transcriptional regulator, MerR family [Pseudomonadota bacterium]
MNSMMNIGAVERDTGLGKDTLRVWERRYGFPQPVRDANGERLYPDDQVDRLRLIKRLMDQGHRPGRLFAAGEDELLQLASAQPPARSACGPEDRAGATADILARLKAHDAQGLSQALKQAMLRQGLELFVLNTVAALNRAVGDAWMRGELAVFEEHLYAEQIKSLLRQAIGNLPAGADGRPRILLTTVPEERHVLGLLMAECLLSLDGATCISLGAQTPLADIAQAAAAHRADIVALSFSSAFPARLTGPLLAQLRAMLPPAVRLWAGGAGSQRLAAIDGVEALPTLEEALAALRAAN